MGGLYDTTEKNKKYLFYRWTDFNLGRILNLNLYTMTKNSFFIDDQGVKYSPYKTNLIEAAWYIKEYDIPEGVTTVGRQAFLRNSQLKKITFPSTLREIHSSAFEGCGFEELDLPEGLLEIHPGAFYQTPIKTLKLPSTLRAIGEESFMGCLLTHVELPESLVGIGEAAFDKCLNLESITSKSPNFKSVDGVLYSGDMKTLICYPCAKKCEHYEIPEGVETIAFKAFSDVEALKSVTFPKSLKVISDYAFSACRALERVDWSDQIKSIGLRAFYPCEKLSEVKLYNGLEEIGPAAFYCCYSIKSISVPSTVKVVGDQAFTHCCRLSDLELGEGIEVIHESAFSRTSVGDLVYPKSAKIIPCVENIM